MSATVGMNVSFGARRTSQKGRLPSDPTHLRVLLAKKAKPEDQSGIDRRSLSAANPWNKGSSPASKLPSSSVRSGRSGYDSSSPSAHVNSRYSWVRENVVRLTPAD